MSDKLAEVRREIESWTDGVAAEQFSYAQNHVLKRFASVILTILDRPDERGEGDALRWLRENVASAFNAAYNEGLLDAPRGGYHDGTGVTKREYRSVWQEYEAKLRSALQPPAPTTGDEGKDMHALAKEALKHAGRPADMEAWVQRTAQAMVADGCALDAMTTQAPPHQAQTHAFVGCADASGGFVPLGGCKIAVGGCHYVIGPPKAYGESAQSCAQPESAPCHGREGEVKVCHSCNGPVEQHGKYGECPETATCVCAPYKDGILPCAFHEMYEGGPFNYKPGDKPTAPARPAPAEGEPDPDLLAAIRTSLDSRAPRRPTRRKS